MRNLPKRGLVVGTLVAMAGLATVSCATMSQEQCLRGDWRAVGYGDGVDGRPMSRLDDHAKACAKAGVTPDAKL